MLQNGDEMSTPSNQPPDPVEVFRAQQALWMMNTMQEMAVKITVGPPLNREAAQLVRDLCNFVSARLTSLMEKNNAEVPHS